MKRTTCPGEVPYYIAVFLTSFTILGCIKTPSFATAEIAVIICKGVIVKRCPKDMVASSTAPTLSSGQKELTASPDKLIPVLSKKPKAL